MNDMADPRALIAAAQRRLTWQRRLEWTVQGLVLGSAGILGLVLWRAAVDPAFPWEQAAGLVALAGVAPSAVYAWRHPISPDVAAWYLDRKLGAGDRLLTWLDLRRGAGRDPAFGAQLVRETAALASRSWRPSWRRIQHQAMILAAFLVVAGLLLALAPPAPVIPSPGGRLARGTTAGALDQALRVGEQLRAQGEAELAEQLDQVVRRGVHAPEDAREAGRMAETLEDRLRGHEQRLAWQAALRTSPEGRTLLAVLEEPGRGGVSLLDQAEELASGLDQAVRIPALPPRLKQLLREVREALRKRDAAALQAALQAGREDLARGGSASPRVLAEAAELLTVLASGRETSSGSMPGDPGSVRPAKNPGPGGQPGIRGGENGVTVRDPDLRRVIRRYFTSNHGKK